VLERFETRYLTTHTLLDTLLEKAAPSHSDARKLRRYAPNNLVAYGYFFGKLNDPAWLEPLRAEGFFTQPPEPEYDYDKGTIRFPLWPAAQYLTRVARLAPQTVLEIALEIPETENVHVPVDIADIALALPARMAAQLVPRFKAWTPFHISCVFQKGLARLLSILRQVEKWMGRLSLQAHCLQSSRTQMSRVRVSICGITTG